MEFYVKKKKIHGENVDEREGERERETKEKERMCICASVHALGSTARRACRLFLSLSRKRARCYKSYFAERCRAFLTLSFFGLGVVD